MLVCWYVCMYVRYVCTYVRTYVCMYVRMYVCICQKKTGARPCNARNLSNAGLTWQPCCRNSTWTRELQNYEWPLDEIVCTVDNIHIQTLTYLWFFLLILHGLELRAHAACFLVCLAHKHLFRIYSAGVSQIQHSIYSADINLHCWCAPWINHMHY